MIKDALKFENNIYDLINHSNLTPDTAYYILKYVLLDLEKTLNQYIQQEEEMNDMTETDTVFELEDEKKEALNNEQPINTDASEYSGSNDDNQH
jgi:hypothetical protein